MARPLGDLVEQIRGSLDYYRGAAGRAAAAAGHAHRRRLADARASPSSCATSSGSRSSRPHRASSSRSATSGSRPTGSRTSTRTSRRRPGSRSAGSRPAAASTSSAARAPRPRRARRWLADRRRSSACCSCSRSAGSGGSARARSTPRRTGSSEAQARERGAPERRRRACRAPSRPRPRSTSCQGQARSSSTQDISWSRMLPGDRAHDPERHLAHRVPGYVVGGRGRRVVGVDARPGHADDPDDRCRRRDRVDHDHHDDDQHDDGSSGSSTGSTRGAGHPARDAAHDRRRHRDVHGRRARLPVGLGVAPAHRHPDPVVRDLWVPTASRGADDGVHERPRLRQLLVDRRHHAAARSDRLDKRPSGRKDEARHAHRDAIAGGVVLILLWYFVLFSPTSSDLNDTRDQVVGRAEPEAGAREHDPPAEGAEPQRGAAAGDLAHAAGRGAVHPGPR